MNVAGFVKLRNVLNFGYVIVYDVHIPMPLGRGLHSASRLQEWSRKEDLKNFSLMFRHDGDVVNFLMFIVINRFSMVR